MTILNVSNIHRSSLSHAHFLQNRRFSNFFCKFQWKTSVLESLFDLNSDSVERKPWPFPNLKTQKGSVISWSKNNSINRFHSSVNTFFWTGSCILMSYILKKIYFLKILLKVLAVLVLFCNTWFNFLKISVKPYNNIKTHL